MPNRNGSTKGMAARSWRLLRRFPFRDLLWMAAKNRNWSEIYLIGPDRKPYRLGFALGNEFSDHVTERQNYLWLAHSKLRYCSFGPELRLGEVPQALEGVSRVLREGSRSGKSLF